MADVKILTLDEIRVVADLPRETVEVPEWGGAVVVQGVSVEDGMKILNATKRADGTIDEEKATMLAVIHGVVEPKFTDAELPWLKQKSLGAVTRIAKAFSRLSGLEASKEDAKKGL